MASYRSLSAAVSSEFELSKNKILLLFHIASSLTHCLYAHSLNHSIQSWCTWSTQVCLWWLSTIHLHNTLGVSCWGLWSVLNFDTITYTKQKNRLYGCLRIAMGWIIFHIRSVDDGRFRRSVCEALFVCYLLQAIAVLRAQFTDRRNMFNWVAICLLSLIGFCYGRFRFGRGGNMIKVYELPQNNTTMRWHTYIFTQKMIVHIIEGTQINHNTLLLFC